MYFVHLSLFVCLTGCAKKTAIRLDDWWNVDYAKNTCQSLSRSGTPCIGDPTAEVRNFEREIGTAITSDSRCHDITVISYAGPNAPASENVATQWQLMLDFVPGQATQSWSMLHKSDRSVTTGQGTAKDIALSVCAVVKHVGGSFREP